MGKQEERSPRQLVGRSGISWKRRLRKRLSSLDFSRLPPGAACGKFPEASSGGGAWVFEAGTADQYAFRRRKPASEAGPSSCRSHPARLVCRSTKSLIES